MTNICLLISWQTSKSKMIIDKEGYQLTRKYLKAYRKAMALVPVHGLIEVGLRKGVDVCLYFIMT